MLATRGEPGGRSMGQGRSIRLTLALVAAALAAACAQPGGPGAAAPVPGAGPVHEVAGVVWTVPDAWTAQPSRAMRVATYAIPAAPGATAGECAVYFFGRDQGGSVDANIDRWAGQFQGVPAPVRVTQPIAGLKVTAVEIRGTYLAAGGPATKPRERMPDAELLGAAVQGPSGPVFFKCVGPRETMRAERYAFDAMIGSVHRAP